MKSQKSTRNIFGKMQQTFIASSTLKRNRRYLDIEKINNEEENLHIKRRKPLATSKSIEAKINRSFSNSTAAITQRLDKDISRFKSRFNSQERPSTARSFYIPSQQNFSQSKIKGVGIGQQLSRDEFYKIKQKPVLDERFFNNFYLQKPDEKHTTDLGRGPQRNFDNSLKHISDIEYNTQALYQKYYYKSTTMDCRFRYKKQKEQPRSFFNPKKQQDMPATDLSSEDVKKAAQTVRIKPKIDSFFMNSARQLPCQLQQRTGTALTSHWRDLEGQINRPKVEYSVRCMKQRLLDQRRQSIAASKRPHFKRNELCDKKYFIVTTLS